jgi:hypothetical protein
MEMIAVNLVTPKTAAKQELLFNKHASGASKINWSCTSFNKESLMKGKY